MNFLGEVFLQKILSVRDLVLALFRPLEVGVIYLRFILQETEAWNELLPAAGPGQKFA